MVNSSDLVAYLTGDGTHLGSRGGPITEAKLISSQLNNGFTDLDWMESRSVIDHYMCLYAKNDNNAGEKIRNFTAYLEFQPTTQFQTIALGKGTAGKNAEESTIANSITSPSGVTWRLNPNTFGNGILLGEEFSPGDFQSFWIWRRNRPNTVITKGSRFRLVLAADPPAGTTTGGSGSGTGGTGGGGTGGGGTGGGTTTPPPPPPDPVPPPPTIPDISIGLGGDFSCNSDGGRTMTNLIDENCTFYVLTGDYSYQDTATCFTNRASPIRTKTYIAFGNHEREEGTPQPALTNAYLNFFNLTRTWYGVVNNGVLVVVLDPYSSFGVGSTQYNDIKAILENNKNNPNVNWRLLVTHEPWMTIPSDHSALTSQRRVYWKLAQDNKVDLILHGHNHNYQRSFPLTVQTDTSSQFVFSVSNPQNNPNWTRQPGDLDENENFIIIAGNAGRARDSLNVRSQDEGIWAKWSSSFHGYSIIEITENAQKLTWKHYNNNKTLFDIFSIHK